MKINNKVKFAVGLGVSALALSTGMHHTNLNAAGKIHFYKLHMEGSKKVIINPYYLHHKLGKVRYNKLNTNTFSRRGSRTSSVLEFRHLNTKLHYTNVIKNNINVSTQKIGNNNELPKVNKSSVTTSLVKPRSTQPKTSVSSLVKNIPTKTVENKEVVKSSVSNSKGDLYKVYPKNNAWKMETSTVVDKRTNNFGSEDGNTKVNTISTPVHVATTNTNSVSNSSNTNTNNNTNTNVSTNNSNYSQNTVRTSTPVASSYQNSSNTDMRSILRGFGLGYVQVEAIMANLMRESSLNPNADSGTGYHGLAQWGGSRLDSLRNTCGGIGTVSCQLNFMYNEMKSGINGFNINTFNSYGDVNSANEYFKHAFEGA